MADVPPKVYQLVCLVVHLVGCLKNMAAVDSGIPFARKHVISSLASDTVMPNVLSQLSLRAASDDLQQQQYLAGVRYQRYTPVFFAELSVRSFFLWSTMMMAYFHYLLLHLPPLPSKYYKRRYRAVSIAGRDNRSIVEGAPRQLNGDSARSDSIGPTAFVSVREQADDVFCQLLHLGLNS